MSQSDPSPPKSLVKRGRGRPKAQTDADRRSMIIDVARRTFSELGLTGTTTDIVANRCKISKQTLYRLFPSKIELFVAVVASHRQMMLDLPRPPDEDGPMADIIGKIFMIDIDADMEREREAFIRTVIRESHQLPEFAEVLFREGPDATRKDLSIWLQMQMDAGKLELDDAVTGARILMDLLFGGIGPGPKGWQNLDARRRHMQQAIAIFVRGTAPLRDE